MKRQFLPPQLYSGFIYRLGSGSYKAMKTFRLRHPLFSMYGRKRRVVEELRELSFRAIESFIDEISYE